jgi:hypothetical protein
MVQTIFHKRLPSILFDVAMSRLIPSLFLDGLLRLLQCPMPKSLQYRDHSEDTAGKPSDPACLGPLDGIIQLMECDGIFEELGLTSIRTRGKSELYNGIVFLYQFFQSRTWGTVHRDYETGKYIFNPITTTTSKQRVELIKVMVMSHIDQVLQLACVENDQDLAEVPGYDEAFEYYRRRLVRFFSLSNSFGCMEDMSGAINSLCLQQWDSSILICLCDMVSLCMQRDLPSNDERKGKVLNRSAVACQHLSSQEVFDFVMNDYQLEGFTILKKLFGKKDIYYVLKTFEDENEHDNPAFDDDWGFLELLMERYGPIYCSFLTGNMLYRNDGNCQGLEIPCFNEFNKPPVSYLLLEEEEWRPQKEPQNDSLDSNSTKDLHFQKTLSSRNGNDRQSGIIIGGTVDKDENSWFLVRTTSVELPLFLASKQFFRQSKTATGTLRENLISQLTLDNHLLTDCRYAMCSAPFFGKEGSYIMPEEERKGEVFGLPSHERQSDSAVS